METNNTTSKLIRGDETTENQNGTSCSESFSECWGDDKPFNDVFNSLSTDDADKVSVDIIKETLNSIWKEKGRRVYEDPLEAFDTEMQS